MEKNFKNKLNKKSLNLKEKMREKNWKFDGRWIIFQAKKRDKIGKLCNLRVVWTKNFLTGKETWRKKP